MLVDYKHRIGFPGPILIEPKPKEPTKHRYDFDAATVYGFLARYDLLADVKLNLEQNHAILAGHSLEHKVAVAYAHGIFGSLDINLGDDLLGWDTDQFDEPARARAGLAPDPPERRLRHGRAELRR